MFESILNFHGHYAMIFEFLTIIIAGCGMIVSLHHGAFFKNQKNILALRLRKNFLFDAALYGITFLMGIGLYYDLEWMVKLNIMIRPLVLILAVWASMRLYRHYKNISTK